jgi:hypothetical protein
MSPRVQLGNREFSIDRPLVETRKSVRFAEFPEVLVPGTKVSLVPGDDPEMVVAAVIDWTP